MSTGILNGAVTVLSLVSAFVTRMLKSKKTDSLPAFTKSTRVEPIVMIDRRVAHLSILPDVMQSLSSIFSAYYLQAVAIMTHVESVNVIKVLDTLNPQRDVADASAAVVDYVGRKKSWLSSEAYEITLPSQTYDLPVSMETFTQSNIQAFYNKYNASLEAASLSDKVREGLFNADGTPKNPEDIDLSGAAKHVRDNTGRFGNKNLDDVARAGGHGSVNEGIKVLHEAVNLSVGKMLSVKIGAGENSATFPIMVRLIATFMDSGVLVHILGDGSRNITMKERYHSWRSGQLQFWRDLVWCNDLIDEHKRALLKDKSGTYDEILERRLKNGISARLTDTPSIGNASNVLVISRQTATELERDIGGSLERFDVRQKVFNSTYVMIMAVIEPEEIVTFYHRGIKLPSRLSRNELKVSNKDNGPDIGELLKAYMIGNAPSY